MRCLSAPELLEVWEHGLERAPVERALMLWQAACPDASWDALAVLSIGQRDGELLTLREWIFGPQIAGLAACPECGQRLEINFNVADVRVAPSTDSSVEEKIAVTDYEVSFRPPNSLDVMAIAPKVELSEKRKLLFERCVLEARYKGEPAAPDRLPPELIDRVTHRIAEADPQADVRLDISCASCGHRWREIFDVVNFFWTEIDAWARRLLREVHILASAYGWSERDILLLSPWRRQAYLEMIGA
jgi:hypothetical protein